MLNRIYIIVGLLAILALGAAFIAPRFIEWGDYRERMEVLAAGAFGSEVHIHGHIEFTLLPQPVLRFADVVVGEPASPTAEVEAVEAEFSLMDFLTDRYTITRLVLERPSLVLSVGADGTVLEAPGAPATTASNVSIHSAQIVDGRLRLVDERAEGEIAVERIDGELRLGALRGPFQFQGSGSINDRGYRVRFNSAALDEEGTTRVSLFTQPSEGGFSVSLEGTLGTSATPQFEGALTYRQSPADTEGDLGRGDMVLESEIQATPEQILLTAYTLVPDENRPGTRLTGAAVVKLGAQQEFNAVISAGVLALPPRDATEEQVSQPYELVRLLAELPQPTIIPLPGTLNVDIAEVNLRGLSLRDVRLDAATDGRAWRIDTFLARLPGDTGLQISGQLSALEGRAAFTGHANLSSSRLNALAQLWKEPEETEPLFNLHTEVQTDIALLGDRIDLSNFKLVLDEATHTGSVGLTFGPERRLDMAMAFGPLSPQGSRAVEALLPDFDGDAGFAATFPQGSLDIVAASATLLGLDGTGLAAQGSWGTAGLQLERLAAEDFGGLGFDVRGTVAGSLAQPVVSGTGNLRVDEPGSAALEALYLAAGTPQHWRDLVQRSLPMDVAVELGAPIGDAGQHVGIEGLSAGSNLNISAQLSGGVAALVNSPLVATVSLAGNEAGRITRQLGLGETELVDPAGPLQINVELEGTLANSLVVRADALAGEDNAAFQGQVALAEAAMSSLEGSVVLALSEATGLADAIGAPGLHLPELQASANISVNDAGEISISELQGMSGGSPFTGDLSLRRPGGNPAVSGSLDVEVLELHALGSVLGGPTSAQTLEGGIWPDGPILVAESPRQTSGSIAVTADLWLGGSAPAGTLGFDFAWDATETRIRALKGTVGAARVEADIAICCAGPLPDKQLSGRIALTGAPLDSVLPAAAAGVLDGVADFGVQFGGTGPSLAGIVAALSGEGSFTVRDFSVERFGPAVFSTVAGLDNIIEMPADALTNIAALAVESDRFTAPQVGGAFTIAGGTLRIANLGADGAAGRLFGGLSLRLADLGLSGSFTMSPLGLADTGGLISETAAQITANLAGTLLAPINTLDLNTMVDAVQLRANELELDRLEQLRLADEERSRLAAEERNRLIAEQRRKFAEEEAARRAEAERLAAEAEARQRELDAAAGAEPAEVEIGPLPDEPLDLGLPPTDQTF